MCAIVDANAASEVFGKHRSGAGSGFLDWLDRGDGVLVVGGKLYEELAELSRFLDWAADAIKAGGLKRVNAEEMAEREQSIVQKGGCLSNDSHVLGLGSGKRCSPVVHE